MDAIRDEMLAWGVDMAVTIGWKVMINILKENETKTNQSAHPKYFVPITAYDKFLMKSQ